MRQFRSDCFPCATGREKVLTPFQGGEKNHNYSRNGNTQETDQFRQFTLLDIKHFFEAISDHWKNYLGSSIHGQVKPSREESLCWRGNEKVSFNTDTVIHTSCFFCVQKPGPSRALGSCRNLMRDIIPNPQTEKSPHREQAQCHSHVNEVRQGLENASQQEKNRGQELGVSES